MPLTLEQALRRIAELEELPRKIIRVSNETAGLEQWLVNDAAALVPDEPRTVYTYDDNAALARQVIGPETATDPLRRFKAGQS